MAISDDFARLELGQVVIQREARQRKRVDLDSPAFAYLCESIRRNGILQPLIVTRENVLVAGERRLEAARKVGLSSAPVRFADELSPIEARILEFEENAKRLDLPWQDLVLAVGELHGLYTQLDPDWTQAETAAAISLTGSTVSIYLKVWPHMSSDEKIPKCTTVREAYSLLDRRDSRAAGDALQEILDIGNETEVAVELAAAPLFEVIAGGRDLPKVPAEVRPRLESPEACILHEDFLHWAPKYAGKKFNLIHCDFPYGTELFAGRQSGRSHADTYDDSWETFKALLECLCSNLDRLMSVSGHLMFWASSKFDTHAFIRECVNRLCPSLSLAQMPLIWTKSDNAGIASDPRRGPRHVYETCLIGSRGARQIVKVVSDSYTGSTDKRFHVSTKPEPVLRHFMQMFVDEHTHMLDPTSGGGSALRIAEELGAKSILGLDVDERCVGISRQALGHARGLRIGNRALI